MIDYSNVKNGQARIAHFGMFIIPFRGLVSSQMYSKPSDFFYVYFGRVKPDTHDETFVCNFCLQLLCVSYTTVQTMKLLSATLHYLLLFPA